MIIVSLTTTSDRLKLCTQTLISLNNQKLKPDKIEVWISREPYLRDKGIDPDQEWLNEIKQHLPLVEIKWTENTGPYRKILPALSECSEDDYIISADDDIVYGREWLWKIIEAHRIYPGAIIAVRARQVKRNKLGRETTYLQWPIIRKKMLLQSDFVITFGGGVLFQKSFLNSDDIKNKDFLEVAPTSDDLWLSRILEIRNIEVRCIPEVLDELFFIEHKEGLIKSNSPELNTKIQSFLFWAVYKRLGNLGFSICQNDIAFKNTKSYFRNRK